HLARLGRKSLSFSKSVELHDKVIGHYLNIKHYQEVGVITHRAVSQNPHLKHGQKGNPVCDLRRSAGW
ncbi:IS1 family transposase, partial [Escherichia coli]|uniref:IS1 family transposase n=1 Tax=Escherichia coli TaxID=562 RepID=UPI003DA6FDF5